MTENTGPYKGEGETVYATDPEETLEPKDRDWPDHTDPEWLRYQYHTLNKSIREIGDEYDIHRSSIHRSMERHGIERRDISKANGIRHGDKLLWDKDWLEEKYIDEKLSTVEIANLRDTGSTTVEGALKRFNIQPRHFSEGDNIAKEKKYSNEKYRDKKWLEFQYWDRLKSTLEIAEDSNCSKETIRRWLNKYDIPIRSKSEAKKIQHSDTEVTFKSSGYEREVVVEGSGGDVILDQSWQYFQERPAANNEGSGTP